MHAFKYRNDRDYVRPSRRQARSDKIVVADENSVATPSPVHALYATLESQMQQHVKAPSDSIAARLHQSRLTMITGLAALCWASIGAITWLAFS